MNQDNLFGNEFRVPEKKRTHFYDRWSLCSALIKYLRFGDIDRVLEIIWIMISEGHSQFYIAKKLVNFASEDCCSLEAFNYATSTFLFIKETKGDPNALEKLAIYLCQQPKFWESEAENKMELKRFDIMERIEQNYRDGIKTFEIDDFCYDVHTSKGKGRIKRGEFCDQRFSGVRAGTAYFCRAVFLRDGKLDPNLSLPENFTAPHIYQAIAEGLDVDDYLKKYDLTPEEFLKPDTK